MQTLKSIWSDWKASTPKAAVSAPPTSTPTMGGRMIDNLSRSVGQMSRRESLAIAAKGVIGIALAKAGVTNSWAAANCLCGGQTYDSDLSCCTPAGVVDKNPIANLAACPNRTANPLHTCEVNGCGAKNGRSYPNSFLFLVSFYECCGVHDCCYDACTTQSGVKEGCDADLGLCIAAQCTPLALIDAPLYEMCLATAATYYAAVRFGGQSAYDDAQKSSCDCCADKTCKFQCAGGTCGAFPACTGGGDCVCFTSPNGQGACIHGNTPCSSAPPCGPNGECPPGYGCAATNCCGTTALCGPLCSDVSPALTAAQQVIEQAKGGGRVRTLGGK